MRPARRLGLGGLVFVMFFSVSGGPFTLEELVHQVGPGLALLVLLLVPLLWAVPETLLIGELSSALPVEGGYYRWVYRALGPAWAFQNGYLTWAFSLADMAIYPVLFHTYLGHFLPGMPASVTWLVSLAMIWIATFVNLRGAVRVGTVSMIAGGLVLGVFGLVTATALGRAAHLPWIPLHNPERTTLGSFGVGLSIALWNYLGWDNASTAAGEMDAPAKNYPRALAIAVPLITLAYVAPLAAALAATDVAVWKRGAWPEIARVLAGPLGAFLPDLVALAGMTSAVALFNALLMSYSRLPLALATDGLLPEVLARTDQRGTPRAAILFSAVLYSVFALLPFTQLVVADVLLYSTALLLELAALVVLRYREPDLRGPFRIPLGARGVVLLAAIPGTILLGVLVLTLFDRESGLPAVLAALAIAGLGPLLYRSLCSLRARRAVRTASARPTEHKVGRRRAARPSDPPA